MNNPIFNDDDHTATLDGKHIGRVTSIISNSHEALFGKKPYEFTDYYYAERGTEAHRAIHFDENGTLDIDTVSNDVMPYLLAWRDCKSVLGFTNIENEIVICNRAYWYCGQCDMKAKVNGRTVIADFKTGVPTKHDCLQTAAYAYQFKAENPLRMAIYLNDDATWKVKYHEDDSDYSVFLSCANIYNRKTRDGVKR